MNSDLMPPRVGIGFYLWAILLGSMLVLAIYLEAQKPQPLYTYTVDCYEGIQDIPNSWTETHAEPDTVYTFTCINRKDQ